MNSFYKRKLLPFLFLPMVAFLSSCVDTSNPVIPSSINYSSQIKVVNLITGSGNTTFKLNGQNFGSADFGEETPTGDFATVASGSKTLSATFANNSSKSFKFAAPTEYKFRVFLIGSLSDNDAKVVTQRYIWQTKNSSEGAKLFPDNKGQLLFFNGSPDVLVEKVIVNSDTVNFDSPLQSGSNTTYLVFNNGNSDIKVVYNSGTEYSFNYNVGSKNRYTVVIYDSAANLKHKVFLDD